MGEREIPLAAVDTAPACPPPPLEHLRQRDVQGEPKSAGTIDRKHGNPGPAVRPYGVQTDEFCALEQPPSADEPIAAPVPEEDIPEEGVQDREPQVDETVDKDEDRRVNEALEELKKIFPQFKEDWLRRCIIRSIIKDKYVWTSLDQTANWIYDYENLAPKKDTRRSMEPTLVRFDRYEDARKMLRELKHETNHEYIYYAELKLTQKFPQFSIYSLRKVLNDCDNMYPLAALNIAEGLERVMIKDPRTWKDWERGELIYITAQRADGEWFNYPMCVVKGPKFWCKKKAKSTVFPSVLAQEIRLVEQALEKYEERAKILKAKKDVEETRRKALANAIEAGGASECAVCGEYYLTDEQVTCTEGHEFCLKCLQQTVSEAINGQMQLSARGDLGCIDASCERGVFPLSMLCHTLPPETMRKLEERLWIDFLAKADIPNLQKCPGCQVYAEEIETPVDVLRLFVCKNPRCGFKSCRNCKQQWEGHEGKSCKEMILDPETALRQKYEDMLNEVTIRKCVRCKRPQTKTEGCNKLTCPCGGKMCYLCRKPINDYSHFCQHRRDDFSKLCGEKCGKCELFKDPEELDETMRQNLQRQLQEELLQLKLNLEQKTLKMGGGAKSMKAPQVVQPAAMAVVPPEQRQFAAMFG